MEKNGNSVGNTASLFKNIGFALLLSSMLTSCDSAFNMGSVVTLKQIDEGGEEFSIYSKSDTIKTGNILILDGISYQIMEIQPVGHTFPPY